MSSLLADLRDLREISELGEAFPVDDLAPVLQRIPVEAPSLSEDDVRAVLAEVQALQKLAATARHDVADLLDKLAQGRDGIRGYNSLQAHHRAQRLSKRA